MDPTPRTRSTPSTSPKVETYVPVEDLQPVATGIPVQPREGTSEQIAAEDAESEQQNAEDVAPQMSEEELCERQARNEELWRDVVKVVLQKAAHAETAVSAADAIVEAFDKRFERGWFAHQFNLEDLAE